jgi:hypothetical protein
MRGRGGGGRTENIAPLSIIAELPYMYARRNASSACTRSLSARSMTSVPPIRFRYRGWLLSLISKPRFIATSGTIHIGSEHAVVLPHFTDARRCAHYHRRCSQIAIQLPPRRSITYIITGYTPSKGCIILSCVERNNLLFVSYRQLCTISDCIVYFVHYIKKRNSCEQA